MRKSEISKVKWSDIRDEVHKVNSELAQLIDDIDPDESYCLYRARFSYGTEILKKGHLLLPNKNGGMVPYDSQLIEPSVQEDLGYNFGTNPVSLILKNTVEVFYPSDNHSIPLYGTVPTGSLISTWKVLSTVESHGPAFLWDMTSGARSIFMLPKIFDHLGHSRLVRQFKLSQNKPKKLLDQWRIFRELSNHTFVESPWESEMIFFGKKWFENLDDEAFRNFQLYLFKKAWDGSNFFRHQFILELLYSLIVKDQNISADAAVIRSVLHLLSIAVGAAPGFGPALDNTAAPIDLLTKIYSEIYQIKPYAAIFMVPEFYKPTKEANFVYHSRAYPTIREHLIYKSNYTKAYDNFIAEEVLDKLLCGLRDDKYNIDSTPISKVPYLTDIHFYHNKQFRLGTRNTKEIYQEDERFQTLADSEKEFPSNSRFLIGCARIGPKENE